MRARASRLLSRDVELGCCGETASRWGPSSESCLAICLAACTSSPASPDCQWPCGGGALQADGDLPLLARRALASRSPIRDLGHGPGVFCGEADASAASNPDPCVEQGCCSMDVCGGGSAAAAVPAASPSSSVEWWLVLSSALRCAAASISLQESDRRNPRAAWNVARQYPCSPKRDPSSAKRSMKASSEQRCRDGADWEITYVTIGTRSSGASLSRR
eukprot:7387538-Prymnesium_polylepis.1